MPKAEKGSIKDLANKMKAKGLQKLRWYCQMCQKQCRDENGFKCHITSESHQRQLLLFADNPHKYLDEFSKEFSDGYVELLRRRFGTKRVHANIVYQEYISDRNHLHMNATKWLSLTEFVKYLGRNGICTVDETEKGWFVTWIDRDPETIARQKELAMKDKMDKDDEERMNEFILGQINRAKEKVGEQLDSQYTELTREKDEKLVLSLSSKIVKPTAVASSNAVSVFKVPKAKSISSASSTKSGDRYAPYKKSALEEIKEEEMRKKEERRNQDNWLREGIVVKVITRELGDKFYHKKGYVKKLADRYVAVVKLLETGHTLKLDQEDLETVIPSIGGKMLVVNGEFLGCTGVVKDVNFDEYVVYISLIKHGEKWKTVKLPYEAVCKLYDQS